MTICMYRFRLYKQICTYIVIMKNTRLFKLLIIAAFSGMILWKFNPSHPRDTSYSQEEVDKVSSFILYQRRLTEAMYSYCLSHNYRLDNFVQMFNKLHAKQIEQANLFVNKLQPWERFAFRKEINNAYNEQEQEVFAQIERSYDENKRLLSLINQSLTRYDFCKWADEHPTELFKGKTDSEIISL